MFNFSSKTEVNKSFKISDLNKQINPSKECKEEEKKIEEIILKNVISPKTLNTNEDKEIKEIYVFEILMKEKIVPSIFIKELDKSIKIMTLFIIKYEDYKCGVIAYKKDKFRDNYYVSNWSNDTLYDIPLLSSISNVYKFILSKFLKYEYFQEESVDEYFRRNNVITKLDTNIVKMKKAITNEVQSKKKFEYNKKLKEYIQEREKLLIKE